MKSARPVSCLALLAWILFALGPSLGRAQGEEPLSSLPGSPLTGLVEKVRGWAESHPELAKMLQERMTGGSEGAQGQTSPGLPASAQTGFSLQERVGSGIAAWLEAHQAEIATIQGLTETSTEDELIEVLTLRQKLLSETTAPVLERVQQTGGWLDSLQAGFRSAKDTVSSWLPTSLGGDEGVQIQVHQE